MKKYIDIVQDYLYSAQTELNYGRTMKCRGYQPFRAMDFYEREVKWALTSKQDKVLTEKGLHCFKFEDIGVYLYQYKYFGDIVKHIADFIDLEDLIPKEDKEQYLQMHKKIFDIAKGSAEVLEHFEELQFLAYLAEELGKKSFKAKYKGEEYSTLMKQLADKLIKMCAKHVVYYSKYKQYAILIMARMQTGFYGSVIEKIDIKHLIEIYSKEVLAYSKDLGLIFKDTALPEVFIVEEQVDKMIEKLQVKGTSV